IFLGIIDHLVGAERAHQLDVSAAADTGHIGPECLRNLDRESSDATGRTVDQDLLPSLDLPLIAQSLKGSYPRNRDGSSFFKTKVSGLHRDRPGCARTDILGEGPGPSAKDFVARFELGDILADRFHGPGVTHSQSGIFWFSQTDSQAHDVGRALDV